MCTELKFKLELISELFSFQEGQELKMQLGY